MRNPERIAPFLKEIEKVWVKVPDWRFGQLMSNFLNTLPIDPFFVEEEKMLEYLEKWVKDTIGE